MANTFELINSYTVGSGGAASIDFTAIPATFTDLCVKLSARGTYADDRVGVRTTLNGSTSGYSYRRLYGYDGSSVTSDSGSGAYIDLGSTTSSSGTANTFGSIELYIPNYAGAANKSLSAEFVAEQNSSTRFVLGLTAGLWSNTSAITSVSLFPSNNNFAQYSTAYLYGVKNA